MKAKTFRFQTIIFSGNRRKAYTADVICNRFKFGEVQEEVLGQCPGHSFSASEQKFYLAISDLFQKKNNQGG